MKLLWVATKPPWPTIDGGRLLLFESLSALRAAGADVTLVSPVARGDRRAAEEALAQVSTPQLVPARRPSRLLSAFHSALAGAPWSTTHHYSGKVRRRVASLLSREPHDVVVLEQLQSFSQGDSPAARSLPRVLREQNVESDLWSQAAAASRGPKRVLLAREARRLATAEMHALQRVTATVALSRPDADRLRRLAGGTLRCEVIAPPFPATLPAADATLPGEPAVVLFGSAGWEPNRRAARRFAEEIWPHVARELPGARLHWFGDGAPRAAGVVAHAAPAESREAFAPRSVLVLPIDLASGVRMRILEAWARGVAVVATPEAASGLEIADDRELAIATTAAEFAAALRRLDGELGLYDRRVAAGRERLAHDHSPVRFTERWLDLVLDVTQTTVRGA